MAIVTDISQGFECKEWTVPFWEEPDNEKWNIHVQISEVTSGCLRKELYVKWGWLFRDKKTKHLSAIAKGENG